ncbi:hypothetical protein [Phenylobacterium sp.]|nr:hypothetical protein [Phenylobacterium sp.]MDO8378814.1 hypothetical protein [Phenylobacterium sp.]
MQARNIEMFKRRLRGDLGAAERYVLQTLLAEEEAKAARPAPPFV